MKGILALALHTQGWLGDWDTQWGSEPRRISVPQVQHPHARSRAGLQAAMVRPRTVLAAAAAWYGGCGSGVTAARTCLHPSRSVGSCAVGSHTALVRAHARRERRIRLGRVGDDTSDRP